MSKLDPDRPATYLPVNEFKHLFAHRARDRAIVYDYFASKFDSERAKLVRSLSSKAISLCANHPSRSHWSGFNGGCVLIGDYDRLVRIANVFNEIAPKSEFISLRVIKIDEEIPSGECVQRYRRALRYKMPNVHVLVGLDKHSRVYKMSFGKREWYPDRMECSRQCAMRELFEEFNIQVSPSLWQASQSYFASKGIKETVVWGHCGMFHQVYVPPGAPLRYDTISDTIVLGDYD